jgi:hypothetical protein
MREVHAHLVMLEVFAQDVMGSIARHARTRALAGLVDIANDTSGAGALEIAAIMAANQRLLEPRRRRLSGEFRDLGAVRSRSR